LEGEWSGCGWRDGFGVNVCGKSIVFPDEHAGRLFKRVPTREGCEEFYDDAFKAMEAGSWRRFTEYLQHGGFSTIGRAARAAAGES
jgi:hypothetical protein